MNNDLHITCNCSHPNHMVVFRADRGFNGDTELWIFTQLNECMTRWRRFVEGIKFALGVGTSDPSWCDTLVNHEQIVKISEFMNSLAEKSVITNKEREEEKLKVFIEQHRKLREYDKIVECVELLTRCLQKHPENYEGPCCCQECISKHGKPND